MIILKRTHEKEIQQLRAQHDSAVSSLVELYEARIKDFQDRVEDLRSLVFPKASEAPHPVTIEADSVISGSEKPAQMSEEEFNKQFEQIREVDLLFSGNYSEDLLQ